MDNASYFIKNRSLFGNFPSQDSVIELENNGVRYFVDLTDINKDKNITAYKTKYTYINYPIEDNTIPSNWISFSKFIIKISNIIKALPDNEKLYINCRGGHSRAPFVVACILCYIFNLNTEESLNYTTKCHHNRKNLKEKWKKISCPQNYNQKKFVHKFFESLYFNDNSKLNSLTYGFSLYSNHPIITELGTFENSKLAYDKHINEYSIKNNINIEDIEEKIKIKIMSHILKIKFNTYTDIKNNILLTGLKKIIYCSKEDDFWGGGLHNKGNNYLGKIIYKIRIDLYLNQ